MIQYNPFQAFYKMPFGAVKEDTDLLLHVKLAGDRPVVSVRCVFHRDETGAESATEGSPLRILSTSNSTEERIDADLVTTETIYEFSIRSETIGLFYYHFEAIDQDGTMEHTEPYQLTVYSKDYEVPEWLGSGVMYQIFPDRFAKSDSYVPPKINKNYVLREDWGGIPNGAPDRNGIVQNNDFFGGNLRGIAEKLDYLKTLGVTVLYLNPIFDSYSNHRYDTGDYRSIDPMLGTEADFTALCEKARMYGIRIILDGVFNHTGSDSVYFNKQGRYPGIGAYQSKDSPYYSWYRFLEYPEKYESWWGIDTLPGVNESDPSFLDFIIRSEDSVIRHWLKSGASGFRLDVADELPDDFLEELRKVVKEINPDAAVIGEVWEDASNKIAYGQRRKYFWGNQLDSVMNYPLKDALIDYLLCRIDGTALEQIINRLWENYPKPSFASLMNIMGTHDTKRIYTVLSEGSPDDSFTRQRLFLNLLITVFMPGIPCIYYGDELGMQGDKDPLNRMCFVPDKGDLDILRYYRRLLFFRNKIAALVQYEFQPHAADGFFYAFQRKGKSSRLVIASNTGTTDYLLDLALRENESLKDYFISGTVRFESQGVYRIKENSGIAAWIESTEIIL